ncbi:MAG: hypothetical protein AB1571_01370 [Nanoarchaeota archaeon]
MDKLEPKLKGLLKKYLIVVIVLIVLSRIVAQILAKRVLFSNLLSYPLVVVAVALFFIILYKSIRYAATNYLFKIGKSEKEKRVNNYFYLSFIYSVLVILIGISFGIRGFFNLISGILILFALNGWIIFRLKAGEIEK